VAFDSELDVIRL